MTSRFRLLFLPLLLAMVLMGCEQDTLMNEPATPEANTLTGDATGRHGDATGRYIVVFDRTMIGKNTQATVEDVAQRVDANVHRVYQTALAGFAATLTDEALAALQNDPRIAYIEPDRVVQHYAAPTGVQRIFGDTNPNLDIDDQDDYRVDVDVAIIDTGIDLEHPDLNVAGGVDCSGGFPWQTVTCDPGGDDDHYHGTHVAGTVGGLDNGSGAVGVAPGARLWAVKVLNSSGSGYESNIVAGIDWVAANASTIEVANMSLGGAGFSQAEYDAIQGAVNAGVAFAVAAGNDADDANNYSPASFDNALSVSALADFDGLAGGLGSSTCRADEDDTLANFSNFGTAVDIAAPGVCIFSTFPIEQGSYGTISGTSMASPHVAGALALLASSNNPSNAADVQNLYDTVVNAGNLNWTDDSGDGILERLLDVSSTSTFAPTLVANGGGGTNNPPTASFTYSCTTLSCDFDGSGSSDSDGSVVSYAWDFGDGATASGATASHTYGSDGTYTVTLTVTDNEGATNASSQSVTVSSGGGGGISLSTSGYKVKGKHTVDLTWSGAGSANVDVVRDGSVIATTANDGAYTDNIGKKGKGSYVYQVCEAGTSTCSSTSTVIF